MTLTLQSDRLVLRPFREDDAEPVTRFIGNLDVSRWLTHVPHPYALADAQWFIEKELKAPGVTFALDLDGAFIGAVSHGDMLGYWIAEPFWGKGYATEAAQALITHRFDHGTRDIQSGYHLGNRGSCNVLTKLGFVSTVQETIYSKPLKCDVTLQRVTLTAQDWEART
ncbi:MAG: GNAT family N-acetyltransferase [Sulfitobacter sp.]